MRTYWYLVVVSERFYVLSKPFDDRGLGAPESWRYPGGTYWKPVQFWTEAAAWSAAKVIDHPGPPPIVVTEEELSNLTVMSTLAAD